MKNGRIAVAWSGTTDSVQIRSADLTTLVATYTDATKLTVPSGLAVRPGNGNILVGDTTYNHLVEIEPDGTFVGVVGEGILNFPRSILVLPSR
jgi:hypothetical protein